jgi:aminopeptidase-like protein
MRDTINNLWLKRRSVVSDEYKESLDYINSRVSINRYKVKSGTKCFDWTIPKKWTLKDAYIEVDGEKVVDAMTHPLNVLVGSGSIDITMPFEELLKYIYIDNQNPLSVPYMYEHYDNDRWGFCLSSHDVDQLFRVLQGKQVRAVIDAEHTDGEMEVAEYIKRGKSPDSIALFAHLDHPGQVQDGLSGCAILVEFVDKVLDTIKDNHYTWRILFFPESLGSLAYFSMFPKRMEDIKFAACLEMVGIPNQPLVVQDAYIPNTEFADAMVAAVSDVTNRNDVLQPYRSVVVNDDGVFNAPGVDIPTVVLTRSASRDIIQSSHFKGYHSSKDDVTNVCWENMYEAMGALIHAVNIIETNVVIKRKYTAIPHLSSHGLWVSRQQDAVLNAKVKDILDMLRDYDVTVLDIAKATGLRYPVVASFIAQLEKAGLVKTRRKIETGMVVHV